MQEKLKKKGNFKKGIKNNYFLCLIILFFVSCKKDVNKVKINNDIRFSTLATHFPDTVIKNKEYSGFIIYTSLFDTLNLITGEKRFISLHLKSDKRDLKYKELHKIGHDTFVEFDDTLRFRVVFKENGNNFLNGYIEDEVYVDDKNPNGETRIINKVSPLFKPVFVKEK